MRDTPLLARFVLLRRERWLVFFLVVRRHALGFLLLPLLLAGVILLLGRAGSLLPYGTLQLDAGDCSQPCWQGFQPGISTIDSVQAALATESLAKPESLVVSAIGGSSWRSTFEWRTQASPVYRVRMRFADGVLDFIELDPQRPLYFRELIDLWGTPSHIACQDGFAMFTAQFYYADRSVEIWATIDSRARDSFWQVDPDMLVNRIIYRRVVMNGAAPVPPAAHPWGGFVQANDKGQCY